MVFRLVARLDGGERRVALGEGAQVLGSHPDCDLRLPHPTVSRRHARVTRDADGVTVEDLDSRNGLRLGGRRVASARLEPGDELMIGGVPVRLESVPDADLETAVRISDDSSAGETTGRENRTTLGSGPTAVFALEDTPRLLAKLRAGAGAESLAAAGGEALFRVLPCFGVTVSKSSKNGQALVFDAQREARAEGETTRLSETAGGYSIEVTVPDVPASKGYAAFVQTVVGLVELAGSVRPGESAETERLDEAPPLPDPPTVVPTVERIYSDAARVARGDVSVLILGASGTGKEVLARYIHAASHRTSGPFSTLNCASLPADLLESELFGIERGVATGVEERSGKFEAAHRGTLLLDEIADMAPGTQAKILRVLQSGEVYRLGSSRPRQVDVRVIAATNRDVEAMLRAGEFREDLYHRIATWVVQLPPLRQRRADIVNLAAYFLAREGRKLGIDIGGISRAAAAALGAFEWPGNIRQLENEMARAVLFLEDGELLDTARLSEEIRSGRRHRRDGTLRELLHEVEREAIERALAEVDGRVEAASERLGVSRATLYRRMRELDIESG